MQLPSLWFASYWLALCSVICAQTLPLALTACASIKKAISGSSQVFYLGAKPYKRSANIPLTYTGALNYANDNYHYIISSSQAPTCVVEVGSTDDTAKVVRETCSLCDGTLPDVCIV